MLLAACTAVKGLQAVDPSIPHIGSVGTVVSTPLSKAFHKVGTPRITRPISVSVQSKAFTKASFKAYRKYRETLGKETTIAFHDSLETLPRYYELRLNDLVALKNCLNHERNKGLLDYLGQDPAIRLLSGIAFVMDPGNGPELANADRIELTEQYGQLVLKAYGPSGSGTIGTGRLDVFDFTVNSFCWKTNGRNRTEIANIAPHGRSCPRGTEKRADKLDNTKPYIKL